MKYNLKVYVFASHSQMIFVKEKYHVKEKKVKIENRCDLLFGFLLYSQGCLSKHHVSPLNDFNAILIMEPLDCWHR